MNNPITRVARVQIEPSKRVELLEAYAAYCEAVVDDEDVLAWELCTEADDENVVWFIASFANEEAHARHMATPATAAVLPLIQSAIVGTPTMTVLVSQHSKRSRRSG